MSRWSDQFENHPIHETIQTMQGWLDVEVEEIDSEHEDERRRLSKALELARASIAGLDAELFLKSWWATSTINCANRKSGTR